MFSQAVEIIPILISVFALFCKDKTDSLKVNIALRASISFIFAYHGAIGGAVAMGIAILTSVYALHADKVVSLSNSLIMVSAATILVFLLTPNPASLLTYLPLITFFLYRLGELLFSEVGYRVSMISGGIIFVIYASVIGSWGEVISELVWVLASAIILTRHLIKPKLTLKSAL